MFVVYMVWGSTYLAIRVAVRGEDGFPPFTMGAMRVLFAGILLLLLAAFTRSSLRFSRRELSSLALSGALFWVGGIGLVIWGEQYADSSHAALPISSTPIWVAMMESILVRRVPSLLLVSSLFVGFVGVVVLTAPTMMMGTEVDLLADVVLLLATLSWGMASIMQKRRAVAMAPVVSSAYQHLFATLGFVPAVLFFREPPPSPSAEAWWA